MENIEENILPNENKVSITEQTLENIILDIICTNSKKNADFWKTSTIKDFYITPTEAIELGVIDTVIKPNHTRG